MYRLAKPLLLASIVAGGLMLGDVKQASADDYWQSYWSWYDGTYRPYYHRHYRQHYRGYDDHDDHNDYRYYQRRPYYRHHDDRPSGGGVHLGPLHIHWR